MTMHTTTPILDRTIKLLLALCCTLAAVWLSFAVYDQVTSRYAELQRTSAANEATRKALEQRCQESRAKEAQAMKEAAAAAVAGNGMEQAYQRAIARVYHDDISCLGRDD
jgi:hypothetical protein